MPIAASLPILQTQVANSFNMGKGAQSTIVATIIASAVASAAPMGLFPSAPVPIPLVPSGFSAGKVMIENAFKMANGANVDAVSLMIANGISLIAPLAPPAGLSFLQMQIKNAMSMGAGATPQIVAMTIANAIPQYYMMGGII